MEDVSPFDWAVRPLKKYSNFSGRAPRAEYWWFYLATVVLGIPFRLIDKTVGANDMLSSALNLVFFLPWLAVTVRRLHDTGRSGWWLLLFVGMIIVVTALLFASIGGGAGASGLSVGLILALLAFLGGAITFLVFMVLPGTEGSNDYGPDPYGPSDLEEVFA